LRISDPCIDPAVTEGLRKDSRGRWSSSEGVAIFIEVKSGGWFVYAPCLMQRAPNGGGQTLYLRLLFLKGLKERLLIINF
jgi:hypothetical protein